MSRNEFIAEYLRRIENLSDIGNPLKLSVGEFLAFLMEEKPAGGEGNAVKKSSAER